jgi:hypothetical protein
MPGALECSPARSRQADRRIVSASQLSAINAANTANRIPVAIAIPKSGSLKMENPDVGLASLAAVSARTADVAPALGTAARFCRVGTE